MKIVPYNSAVGSLMYAMMCTRLDIYYVVGIVSRYQSNPGVRRWNALKYIFKYLKRTKNYGIIYQDNNLIHPGYTDSGFQCDKDKSKSTSGYVFTLGGATVAWRSVKQK